MKCPNKNSKEWKTFESQVGKDLADYTFVQQGYNIPNIVNSSAIKKAVGFKPNVEHFYTISNNIRKYNKKNGTAHYYTKTKSYGNTFDLVMRYNYLSVNEEKARARKAAKNGGVYKVEDMDSVSFEETIADSEDFIQSESEKEAGYFDEEGDFQVNDALFGDEVDINDISNLSYHTYVEHKEKVLNSVQDKIRENSNKQRHGRTEILKKEAAELKAVEKTLEEQLEVLSRPSGIFDNTFAFLNEDITLVNELLDKADNIDNMYLAQEVLNYLEKVTDFKDKTNPLFNTSLKTDPEIMGQISKIRDEINLIDQKLTEVKIKHLTDIIDNSDLLKSLYEEAELEELKARMLSKEGEVFDDISVYEKAYSTLRKSMAKDGDSRFKDLVLEEIFYAQEKLQGKTSGNIDKIDNSRNAAERVLKAKFGEGILGTTINYSSFFQKDSFGNKTPNLIGTFSNGWHKLKVQKNIEFRAAQKSAYQEVKVSGNWGDVHLTNMRKLAWINENANFFDLTSVPELASNPDFSRYSDKFKSDPVYRQQLISQIGQQEYDKLVKEQESMLYDYMRFEDSNSDAITAMNNPFSLLSNPSGVIEVEVENGENYAVQSAVTYNTFYPKKSVDGESTGHYDSNFDSINESPELRTLWTALHEGLETINDNLTNGSTRSLTTSIHAQQKNIIDIMFHSPHQSLGAKGWLITTKLGDFIKGLFSQDTSTAKEREDKVNNSGIKSINDLINEELSLQSIKLKRLLGGKLDHNTYVKNEALIEDPALLEFFLELTNSPTLEDFNSKVGGPTFKPLEIMRSYIGNNIVDEQHFDLPSVVNNYLRLSTLYKARKEALPKALLLQDYYNDIKSSKGTARDRANRKLDNWIEKNIKGEETQNKSPWISLGTRYNQEEKRVKKFLEKELEVSIPGSPESELIQSKLSRLGETYAAAAFIDTMFIKATYLAGLGWSVLGPIPNRIAGIVGGVLMAGKHYSEGNFYAANTFTSRSLSKRILGKVNSNIYKSRNNEYKKARKLIDRLDIVQDNTNEFDRAKRAKAGSWVGRVINPFFGIEIVEQYNQHPQILAYLADQDIVDKNGNAVKVFDLAGSLPAFEINPETNQLELKEDFRTPENIATWHNMENNESAKHKMQMSNMLEEINGAYNTFSNLLATNEVFGRATLTFKKWFFTLLHDRVNFNNGIYTDAIRNRESRVAAIAGLAGLASSAFIGPAALAGIGIAAGSLAAFKLFSRNGKSNSMGIEAVGQLSDAALSLIKKMYGVPLNLVSGSHMVDTRSERYINNKDLHNYEVIMKELAFALNLVLMRVMANMLMPDNDEDDEDKEFYYLVENILSSIQQITTIYANPLQLMNTASPSNLMNKLALAGKISEAWSAQNDKGNIRKGKNAGRNRVAVLLQRNFAPSILKGNYGLGSNTEKDFTPNDAVNRAFRTDKVNAIKKNEKERSDFKRTFLDGLKDRNKKTLDKQTPEGRKYILGELTKAAQAATDSKHPLLTKEMQNYLFDKEGNKRGKKK